MSSVAASAGNASVHPNDAQPNALFDRVRRLIQIISREFRPTLVLGRVLVFWGAFLLVSACNDARSPAPKRRLERPRTELRVASASEAAEARLPGDANIDWDENPSMRVLGKIAASLEESEYSHALFVNEKHGVYRFDCSSMVQWVLRRSAPTAASAIAWKLDGRPLARDFQRRIARAPAEKSKNGWRRIARVSDAKPGDVIAWLKPAEIDSPNTGHVAFVVLAPVLAPGYENAYLVRIADSTSLLHDDDTRVGRSGFGLGTILVVTDAETDAPVAYGWVGLRWRAFETDIAIGRPESIAVSNGYQQKR
jgi:hypothetical protein